MFVRNTLLLALAFVALSCREDRPRPPPAVPAQGSSPALPEIPGFAGGPMESAPAYQRRTYVRGTERTTVTLARFAMTSAQYDEWVRMSSADYAQAALDLEASEGNGFYQCAPEDPSRCNLLVQLRCGLHLEIRGQGTTRRRDADDILRGLALPTLAKACRASAIE